MSTYERNLLRPERLRFVERPFAFIPCRLLTSGVWETMSIPAKLLYTLLSLAADKHGISFYSNHSIIKILGITEAELVKAQQELITRDLLAFNGKIYQLLSLPHPEPDKKAQPAMTQTAESIYSKAIPDSETRSCQHQKIPEEARQILKQLFGKYRF